MQVLIGEPKLPLGSCAVQEYAGAPGSLPRLRALRLSSAFLANAKPAGCGLWLNSPEGRPAAAVQNQRGAFLSRLMEFEAGVSCAKSDEPEAIAFELSKQWLH
ncbi:MAG: hypothetical protein LBU32_14545 [Clostridiales bacterium]|nr:hypothetical protein [Clostridiales bacterium]